MMVAVFRRYLKEGKTFEDFERAWEADRGFGVPARVFNAVGVSDDREILTFGFVDVDPAAFSDAAGRVAEQEAVRHGRIEEVIERTELRAFYELRSEHDFSATPREIEVGSPTSFLSGFARTD